MNRAGEAKVLLRSAIMRSGLSNRQFARRLMVRDERTVQRWLSGKQTIPDVVLERLRELVKEPLDAKGWTFA